MESCTTIQQFGSNVCELTNNQTLMIELVAALLITATTVILAVIFFHIQKTRQDKDELQQRIRDLEHSIELITLEIQSRDLKNLVNEIKPIIEKQGKIIEKQEEKERIHIVNLKNNLSFNLQNIRNHLAEIKNLLEKEVSPIRILFDHEYIIPSIDTSMNQITKRINELFSLGIETPGEVLTAQEKIGLYLSKLKHALNSEKGSLETPPDPAEVILQIDFSLKELPEPESS